VLSVLEYDGIDAAIEIATIPFSPLCCNLDALRLDPPCRPPKLKAGTIWINTYLDGLAELRSADTTSGLCRENGGLGVEEFTEVRSFQIRGHGLQEAWVGKRLSTTSSRCASPGRMSRMGVYYLVSVSARRLCSRRAASVRPAVQGALFETGARTDSVRSELGRPGYSKLQGQKFRFAWMTVPQKHLDRRSNRSFFAGRILWRREHGQRWSTFAETTSTMTHGRIWQRGCSVTPLPYFRRFGDTSAFCDAYHESGDPWRPDQRIDRSPRAFRPRRRRQPRYSPDFTGLTNSAWALYHHTTQTYVAQAPRLRFSIRRLLGAISWSRLTLP